METTKSDLQRAIVILLAGQTDQLKRDVVREKNAIKRTLTKAQWKDFSLELSRIEKSEAQIVAVAEDPDNEPLQHALPVAEQVVESDEAESRSQLASESSHHQRVHSLLSPPTLNDFIREDAPAVAVKAASVPVVEREAVPQSNDVASERLAADDLKADLVHHLRSQTVPGLEDHREEKKDDEEDDAEKDEVDDDERPEDVTTDTEEDKVPGRCAKTVATSCSDDTETREKAKRKAESNKKLTSQIVELQEMVLQYQSKYQHLRKKHQKLLSVPEVRTVVDSIVMETGKRPDEVEEGDH